MPSTRALIALCVLATGCASAHTASPPAEWFPAPTINAPLSSAVVVGPILYLSGQIGSDSAGHLVPGGIKAETAQALRNISAVLQAHGSSLDRVIKCTAMLADIGEWGAMNEVYATFFTGHKPARSAFATGGLVRGARIELECMALR
jgi:2-iminobutanoate/2-iminopropanoate deaminase